MLLLMLYVVFIAEGECLGVDESLLLMFYDLLMQFLLAYLHNENDHLPLFQMYTILQDVQFTEQQRFKQFVSQSKARMEVVD